MGTNYYLHAPKCFHCGKEEEPPIHLGKSSGGWCFSLHVYPELALNDWEGMWQYIRFCVEGDGHQLKNEYGEIISLEQFFSIVWDRHRKTPHWPSWLQENHAKPGPFGLARHIVDGQHCIGNAGLNAPIDYFIGEFE